MGRQDRFELFPVRQLWFEFFVPNCVRFLVHLARCFWLKGQHAIRLHFSDKSGDTLLDE